LEKQEDGEDQTKIACAPRFAKHRKPYVILEDLSQEEVGFSGTEQDTEGQKIEVS